MSDGLQATGLKAGTASAFPRLAVLLLLGGATLWLACHTMARDLETGQLQTTLVKPAARWQDWLGKWLGILVLDALLLTVAAAGVAGLQRARQPNVLPLRRAIWQAMNAAFLRGRLSWNQPEQRIEFGPNLDLLENVSRAFAEMLQAEPNRREYIRNAERNWLQDAVYYLYTHNRLREAAQWYARGRAEFPDFAPPGMALDEFVVEKVSQELQRGNNFARSRAIIEGFIGQYYYYGVLGDMDRAEGHLLLARRIHERYQTLLRAQGERLAMPAFIEMQREVVRQIEAGGHGFTPPLRAQLEQVRSDRQR